MSTHLYVRHASEYDQKVLPIKRYCDSIAMDYALTEFYRTDLEKDRLIHAVNFLKRNQIAAFVWGAIQTKHLTTPTGGHIDGLLVTDYDPKTRIVRSKTNSAADVRAVKDWTK